MRERFTTWLLVALAFLAQFSFSVAWFEPDQARASAVPDFEVCRVVALFDRPVLQRPPPASLLHS